MKDIRIDERSKDVIAVMDPDMEFTLREVERFTGYTAETLKRMDGTAGFPKSKRDIHGRRVWRAVDIVRIRQIREERMSNHGGRKNGS